ncbi:hypothetical protein L2E82_16037 [Cichorium intybus]|uniref:Uncharacterized protein n=1 Tax=Cichorium intybus TaxID=13427 RepID=A0ACB9F4G1_CICIN|nr:hypothetical protein L2E82_16037 [Cichorium intybus]
MTLSDYSQNPELLAHFVKPKSKPFRHIKGNLSGYSQNPNLLAYFENPNILSYEMPMGRIPGPCTFCNDMLYIITLYGGDQNYKSGEERIQSKYAPVQQHPASYRVRAYRANVRKHILYQGNEDQVFLKHQTIGPDDPDHFLMYLKTGLNPEAVESLELCFTMNDSYRVYIECISTIVLSDYPFCSSG